MEYVRVGTLAYSNTHQTSFQGLNSFKLRKKICVHEIPDLVTHEINRFILAICKKKLSSLKILQQI